MSFRREVDAPRYSESGLGLGRSGVYSKYLIVGLAKCGICGKGFTITCGGHGTLVEILHHQEVDPGIVYCCVRCTPLGHFARGVPMPHYAPRPMTYVIQGTEPRVQGSDRSGLALKALFQIRTEAGSVFFLCGSKERSRPICRMILLKQTSTEPGIPLRVIPGSLLRQLDTASNNARAVDRCIGPRDPSPVHSRRHAERTGQRITWG